MHTYIYRYIQNYTTYTDILLCHVFIHICPCSTTIGMYVCIYTHMCVYIYPFIYIYIYIYTYTHTHIHTQTVLYNHTHNISILVFAFLWSPTRFICCNIYIYIYIYIHACLSFFTANFASCTMCLCMHACMCSSAEGQIKTHLHTCI